VFFHYYRFLLRYLLLLVAKNKTLGKTVERMAVRRSAAPFLLFEDERLSFAEFNRAANRRAHVFRALPVQQGEVVAVLMENRPEFLLTLAGLAKIGAVTAAINTHLTGRALGHNLEISRATRLVVGAECLDRLAPVLPSLKDVRPADIFVDTRWPSAVPAPAGARDLNALLAEASEENPPPVRLGSMDPLMLIYTAGTTGLPKAARVTHYRWYGAGLGFGFYCWEITRNDVIYCALPLYHSNGALIAFASAMVNGAALAVSRRFSASRFWEDVARQRATAFIYIGELLRYLVNTAPGPFDRAHRVQRALGNGLRPDIWKAFQERFAVPHIREFYASAEGNAYTVNLEDVPGSCGKSVLKWPRNLALVRYDFARNAYPRGADGFCQRCTPGEAGELLGEIRFTTPFSGYTDSQETERKLLRNVFRRGDVFFRTGDLMKRDAQGHYYFIDRIGDTFRWKGENVSTQEVQEQLTAFPGIFMISVFGVKIPGAEGRAGMAVLLLEEGAAFDPAAFYRHAQAHLAPYARPAFVRLAKDLYLTSTFKLRKVELQEAGYDVRQVSDPLYYRDEAQGAYVPLTPAAYETIQAGRVRF
jgi:fatty-acyl-CoA synthase